MNHLITKVYKELNSKLLSEVPFNNSKTRDYVKKHLEKELPNSEVKCDLENNSAEVIDCNCLIARVFWNKKPLNETVYRTLIFGQEDQVIKLRHLL
jgi:hypothetical protein